jgi:hypothetical protein
MQPIASVISPPLPLVPGRTVRSRRIGRPTGKAKGGQASWIKRLLSSGRISEAYAYATDHKLLPLLAGVPLPAALPPGGEGGQPASGDNYNYKSTQEVRILQSGGKLTLNVGAVREVAGAIALAEEGGLVGEAAISGGRGAAQGAAQELHSPDGESEGNGGFGQANREVEKGASASGWGKSRWVEEGEAIVGKVCRNKQYNELRMGRDGGGEGWTKVGNWQWRNGLVRGERVWVRRVWVSGDDTDAEYVVVRRMDVNEGMEAEPVVEAEAEAVAVAEPVAAAVAADAIDTSHVLPQFLKQDTVFPRKPESAEDYIARIREEAAQWANGAGAGA